MIDVIGWIATALFLLSYFAKDRRHLLALQVVAALVWIGYGTLLRAMPVIVANGLVAAAATFSATRRVA
jgi:hypothetical protein